MTKLEILKPWLEEVEAVEEQLEAMKLTAWRIASAVRPKPVSIVRKTSGLLEEQVPPGSVYQRRLRRAWEGAFRQRIS